MHESLREEPEYREKLSRAECPECGEGLVLACGYEVVDGVKRPFSVWHCRRCGGSWPNLEPGKGGERV